MAFIIYDFILKTNQQQYDNERSAPSGHSDTCSTQLLPSDLWDRHQGDCKMFGGGGERGGGWSFT